MPIRILAVSATMIAIGAAEIPAPAEVESLAAEAQAWLLAQARPDGALCEGKMFPLGITAFAAQALAAPPQALASGHPALAGALSYLAARRQPDGGVYDPVEGLGVYGTSLTLQLVVRLPEPARAAFDIPAMQRYLLGNQNAEAGSLGQGGIGYGDKGKGFEDLSNTSYAVQALRSSGVAADDARMQAALRFLERCQDLSAVNPSPWVKNNSGGGVYGPQDAARSWEKGDESQSARWTPSLSMTYSLLSSYLSLELKRDDPRVRAALDWVVRNYGFDANPGMGSGKESQGLFHSYALAATTFDLLASGTLVLPDGRKADWRADLFAALKARTQRMDLPGGGRGAYWVNSASRWGEGMPALCTAYSLRALKAVARSLAP